MTPEREQQFKDIVLVLGEQEVQDRVRLATGHARMAEMARFTSGPDGLGMTPSQLSYWAIFAARFEGATADGSVIYRRKSDAEVRVDVLTAEFNRRTDYGRTLPAVSFEELVKAGHEERAEALDYQYGESCHEENREAYLD